MGGTAYVCGFLGYWDLYPWEPASQSILSSEFLNSVWSWEFLKYLSSLHFYVMQLFLMQVPTPDSDPTQVSALLAVARFCASSTTVCVVLVGLWTWAENWRLKRRMRHSKRHIVICGGGKKGLQLARTFVDNEKHVILIDCKERKCHSELHQDMGVDFIEGDASNKAVLWAARAHLAEFVFAVTSDDETNMEIVTKCYNLVAEDRNPWWAPLRCRAFVTSMVLYKQLRQRQEHFQAKVYVKKWRIWHFWVVKKINFRSFSFHWLIIIT